MLIKSFSVLRAIGTRSLSVHVAVVGSGPAGFYTTQRLLKNPQVKVDIYEKLPIPFGLVRYGVAPDHANVKNVINSFTSVAGNERVNFYGNVSLGNDILLEHLMQAYHAVVLSYGSSQDKLLNIEGETSTKNTISARNFVGWYNGVPEDKNLDINLDCDTACIIGQGNVALDCARLLLKPANLEKTDITTYAQHVISKSRIRKIFIIGRRGPIQVSFTTKELRELLKLNEGKTRLEPSRVFNEYGFNLSKMRSLSRQRRRLTELLFSITSTHTGEDECILKFLSKPHKIVADEETGSVTRIELRKARYNNIDDFMDEQAQPCDTGDFESIDCGLVIRSIGYKAVPLDKNLPVDHRLGAILNTDGKVHGHLNVYCSGWLATGASGVIADTMHSSHTTAQSLLSDIESKKLPYISQKKPGYGYINSILESKAVRVVHFNDWLRIDKFEKTLGESLGKTREKLVDIKAMLDLINK